MATTIPKITEVIDPYSVTPVLNSSTFPEDIDTYNGEQPSRIASKNTVNTQINAVVDAMNIVGVEVENNALVAQSASEYQGDWSDTPTLPVVYPYPLGVSVSNAGKRWASKVNNNTEEPVAESANWALLPEAGIASVVEDTSPKSGGVYDTNSFQHQLSIGADVASATALPILTDGNSFTVTGTTAIESIDTTGKVGTQITLRFADILVLTHHATNLILPKGANITTQAGDVIVLEEYGAGTFRFISYERADGTALTEPISTPAGLVLLSTTVASASATVDIETTFDATYDDYMLIADNVVLSASGWISITMKLAGVYQTSGYYFHTSTLQSNVNTYSSAYAPSAQSNIGTTMFCGVNAGDSCNMKMGIFNPHNTTKYKHIHFSSSGTDGSFIFSNDGKAMCNASTGALTGVRFTPPSGAITSGTFRLYGITKT